ncbi:MAG: DUF3604 domain-containing protein [Halioglobus sp.]|nr:DUF3604 domain-containing protein [Halioglobus sp.]
MLRRILLFLAGLILVGGAWVWWEWDHIAITASAPHWHPPVAAAPAEPAAPRAPCADYEPLRRAWFGDLHIHTRYSMDARASGMLGTVEDAYRYARGEEIGLGPFAGDGSGQRRVQIKTPLDFAAVTDHAEWMGEVVVCTEPGSPAYASRECLAFRGEAESPRSIATLVGGAMPLLNLVGFRNRKAAVCGPDNRWCRESLLNAWTQTQAAAERHYDRSPDCTFTSFQGYEYSNSPGRSKVHRNVIFRNERVPELPVSSLEQGNPLGLWEQLDKLCNRAEGDCEVIAIPHNPNVSNGRLFRVPWRDETLPEQQRQAQLRARLEPVVEMMQVKGESECKSGMWNVFGEDELCDFEKLRAAEAEPEDCRDDYGTGAVFGLGCQSRLDFARYALIEGMLEAARIGVNPYRFGFVGSTDSHNASPGDVAEDRYNGCCANTDNTAAQRLDPAPDFAGRSPAARNPGGLMGVWAEENSRDSLFDAMQRREVFATSGPRIQPRLFVGERLPDTICEGNMAAQGYRYGVPMGGVIADTLSASPLFAAAVTADPDGGLLQRLQLIKVWFDERSGFHQSVVDIAGTADNGASVDLDTCAVLGAGETQLCGIWRDPDFDSEQQAAWYVRVIENPSCRWSWRQCLTMDEKERPATCADPAIPRTIQERAWSSPVWYAPVAADPDID